MRREESNAKSQGQSRKLCAGAVGGNRGITGLETAIVLIAFVVVSSVFAFAALSTGLFSSDRSKETINAGLKEASGTLEMRGSIITKSLAVANESIATFTAAGAVTVLGAVATIPVVGGSDVVQLNGSGLTRVTSSPASGQYSINNTSGVITLGLALTANDVITGDYSAQFVDEISFQVANAAGGGAVDLTPGETIITYTDADQAVNVATGDVTVTGLGSADSDKLVEPGEMYEVKMTGLVSALNPDLKIDKLFSIQLKPPVGAVLHIERTTPVAMDKINDLN